MKCKILYFCFIFLLFGCYKKDLEEFENIKKLKVEENLAFPLFNATITLNDSLNFPNFVVYDTLYLLNTTNIDDSAEIDFKEIKDIEIKLYIENNFPVDGYLQIYFVNYQNIITDSLFSIEKYNVPYSNSLKISEIYLDMNEEKYKRIVNCKNIKVLYFLEKTSSYSSNYKMFIGCGVKARVVKTF